MMSEVAARLPDEQIDALDQLVDEGRYASRSEAVRSGVRRELRGVWRCLSRHLGGEQA